MTNLWRYNFQTTINHLSTPLICNSIYFILTRTNINLNLHLEPSVWVMVSTMALDRWNKYPVIASNGSNTITDRRLNISWTVAPANALRKLFLSPIWPSDTMVLVTLVPIFAPITIGMAGWTFNTRNIKNLSKIRGSWISIILVVYGMWASLQMQMVINLVWVLGLYNVSFLIKLSVCEVETWLNTNHNSFWFYV